MVFSTPVAQWLDRNYVRLYRSRIDNFLIRYINDTDRTLDVADYTIKWRIPTVNDCEVGVKLTRSAGRLQSVTKKNNDRDKSSEIKFNADYCI